MLFGYFRFIFDGVGLVFPGVKIFLAKVFVFGILLEGTRLGHKSHDISPYPSAHNQPFSNRIRRAIFMAKHLLLEAVF